ncbi:MAG: type II secretion system major pseudopilin GspG [Deltaproteobacteria bacterium]|jgi:general secretion pathway protein G|nr:type II secretion system major pseudopilin GspG [Deltaproteobacteria bacterium]
MTRATLLARHAAARRLRAERGLTLVEIMVVIAILGTLMTIVTVNVFGQLSSANVDNTVLQMKKVGSDLDMYAAKHKGKYPSTAEGLSAASKYFADNKVPTDAWGNDFQYFAPATNCQKAYELVSYGADGQQGGEDYDADISSCNPEGNAE